MKWNPYTEKRVYTGPWSRSLLPFAMDFVLRLVRSLEGDGVGVEEDIDFGDIKTVYKGKNNKS